MAELDTARSIVKSLSQKNPANGEIVYVKGNEGKIVDAVLAGLYYIDKDLAVSPHSKWRKERFWFSIDPETVDKMKFEYGQVLNCSVTPCWWRLK